MLEIRGVWAKRRIEARFAVCSTGKRRKGPLIRREREGREALFNSPVGIESSLTRSAAARSSNHTLIRSLHHQQHQQQQQRQQQPSHQQQFFFSTEIGRPRTKHQVLAKFIVVEEKKRKDQVSDEISCDAV